MNLLHVLTQDLEPTPVLVTKDILEMERLVKVKNNSSDQGANLILSFQCLIIDDAGGFIFTTFSGKLFV